LLIVRVKLIQIPITFPSLRTGGKEKEGRFVWETFAATKTLVLCFCPNIKKEKGSFFFGRIAHSFAKQNINITYIGVCHGIRIFFY